MSMRQIFWDFIRGSGEHLASSGGVKPSRARGMAFTGAAGHFPRARCHGSPIVNLAFVTLELRTLCETPAIAERELGMLAAQHLRDRLADLQAADSIMEVLAGNPREADPDGASHYVIDLADGYCLKLYANHKKIPRLGAKVNWAEVTRVMIHAIEKSEVSHG
jgi:hypothetical protein